MSRRPPSYRVDRPGDVGEVRGLKRRRPDDHLDELSSTPPRNTTREQAPK